MYLSRVELDARNRQKIKDLTHVGAYHSWVEDSFPEEEKRGERSRKLWRLDTLHGKTYLLVLSESKPELEKLEKLEVEQKRKIRCPGCILSDCSENCQRYGLDDS